MAVAHPTGSCRSLSVEAVGDVATLLARLTLRSRGEAVVLGVDFPIGLPRAFIQAHPPDAADFPGFLRTLRSRPRFLEVADSIDQVGPERPFYPRRGLRGMTRLSHALALGLVDASGLSRACDRATAERPAGAPLFWTLGANQSGKAAICAWRDLLQPALDGGTLLLWPFDGALLDLARPGHVVVAETYPADALRQVGLRPIGSKRRQVDRLALVPGLRAVMAGLNAVPDGALDASMRAGFGADAAGEDRLDCVLGLLCVLSVLAGRRPDAAPPDPWLRAWEGWVLGQSAALSVQAG